VAGLHCEAVLEHLEFPDVAVGEMFRVLRPGGLVFAATPFLQSYHGYPDHFQNFTLHGHQRLFERAGFSILQSGTCVDLSKCLAAVRLTCKRRNHPWNTCC
jgi:ubiquinone/menaquinone biosynthesis C-methylase UbiE